MEVTELGNVAQIIAGQSPPSKSYNKEGVGLPFLQGKADFGIHHPVPTSWCDSPRKVAQKGDILISVRAPVGPTNFADQTYCIGRGLSAIRVRENLDSRYLIKYLKSIEHKLADRGKGSTFSAITQGDLFRVKVPMPSLDEQRRIASVLDKVDDLRAKRQRALALVDELVQSGFAEMFGDPVSNPKRLRVDQVRNHIKSIRYGIGSPPEYRKKGIPFIRATNVKHGTIKERGLVYISEDDAKKIPKCKISAGNLIIVRSGVNSGDCALVPPEYEGAYAAYDLIVEVDYPTNHFLNHVINSPFGRNKTNGLSRRAAQPHVNAEQINSIEFPFPAESQQEVFARLIARVEAQRKTMHEFSLKIDNLLASLQASYFNDV